MQLLATNNNFEVLNGKLEMLHFANENTYKKTKNALL